MALRLFVVHGSHPCNTVMKALELKDLSYQDGGRRTGAARLPHVAGTTPAGVLSPA